MSKKTLITVFANIFFLFYFLPLCSIISANQSVKKGNKLYKEGNYDEALKNYSASSANQSDSDILNFNIGTALFKKDDFEKAIEAFTKALLTENNEVEAMANYNIGNSKFKLGQLKENSDLSNAVALFREALDYYKRAIELDGKEKDAKFNHEYVENKLKVLLDKLKQQEEKEKDKQENEKENKQEGPQKQQADSADRKNKKEEKQAKAEDEETSNSNEEMKKQETDEEGKGIGQDEGPPPEPDKEGEMSREEARMILKQYGQEEKSAGNLHYKERKGDYREVLKDW